MRDRITSVIDAPRSNLNWVDQSAHTIPQAGLAGQTVARWIAVGTILATGVGTPAMAMPSSKMIYVFDTSKKISPTRDAAITRNRDVQQLSQSTAWGRIFTVLDGRALRGGHQGRAARDMYGIATALRQKMALPPRITFEDVGDVDLVWTSAESYTSISVTADGHLVAYYHRVGMNEPYRMDEAISPDAIERLKSQAWFA